MGLDLYFDQYISVQILRSSQGGCDAASASDVIFLDQNGIEQANPVIRATAAGDRVFLCESKARYRLARVQYSSTGSFDCLDVEGRGRCCCRQSLQEIQRRPFARQQGACRADQFADNIVSFCRLTIADVPVNDHGFIQLREDFIYPGVPAENEGLPRDDACPDNFISINKGCREIATTDILGERAGNAGPNRCLKFV
jgi:hypothetical protein